MNGNGNSLALVVEMAYSAITVALRHHVQAASLSPDAIPALRQAILCAMAGHEGCPIPVPPGLEIGRDGRASALDLALMCGLWFLMPSPEPAEGTPLRDSESDGHA